MSVRNTLIAAACAAGLIVTAACTANAAQGDTGAGAPAGQISQNVDTGSGKVAAAAYTADTNTPSGATINQPSITATATGIVSGTPDVLTVQLGVQTQAKTASEALTENNKKAAELIATLAAQGVDKKDVSTSDLSIYPSYNDKGSEITGYQVSNSVTAVLRDVAKAGSVIDAAARAAGDAIRLNQIGFSFADDSELRAQARANAVKDALAQAKQMADAAGVSLGPILSISENATMNTPQPMFSMAGAADSARASMPVVSGEQQLAVSVQVVVGIG